MYLSKPKTTPKDILVLEAKLKEWCSDESAKTKLASCFSFAMPSSSTPCNCPHIPFLEQSIFVCQLHGDIHRCGKDWDKFCLWYPYLVSQRTRKCKQITTEEGIFCEYSGFELSPIFYSCCEGTSDAKIFLNEIGNSVTKNSFVLSKQSNDRQQIKRATNEVNLDAIYNHFSKACKSINLNFLEKYPAWLRISKTCKRVLKNNRRINCKHLFYFALQSALQGDYNLRKQEIISPSLPLSCRNFESYFSQLQHDIGPGYAKSKKIIEDILTV